MRNLKKILALVLALMMVLSVMVTASAAYADADKIDADYAVAVDIMTKLAVLQGDGTNFNPTGTLTRAEAAVMLSKAHSGKTAASWFENESKYSANPFSDVSGWAVPYVVYCYDNGLVGGRNATTYDPKGTVTGYEFVKMVLVAAGFGTHADYVGDKEQTWEMKVLAAAKDADLLAGVELSLKANITREQASQVTLNGMKAGGVTTTTYYVVTTAVAGATNPNEVPSAYMTKTEDALDAYFAKTILGGGYEVVSVSVTTGCLLASKFDVTYTAVSEDNYGRTAECYSIPVVVNGITLGYTPVYYPVKALATYTGVVAPTTIAADLAGYKTGIYAVAEDTVSGINYDLTFDGDVYTDYTMLGGDYNFAYELYYLLAYNPNTVVEVYGNPLTGQITEVVAVKTYAARVDDVTPNNPYTGAYGTVTLSTGDTFTNYYGYEKGQVLTYTWNKLDAVDNTAVATGFAGTLTNYTSNGRYTINGTVYTMDGNADPSVATPTLATGASKMYYVGAGNTIIFVDNMPTETPVVITDYAYIYDTYVATVTAGIPGFSTASYKAQIKVVLTDGTVETWDVPVNLATKNLTGVAAGHYYVTFGVTNIDLGASVGVDALDTLNGKIYTYADKALVKELSDTVAAKTSGDVRVYNNTDDIAYNTYVLTGGIIVNNDTVFVVKSPYWTSANPLYVVVKGVNALGDNIVLDADNNDVIYTKTYNAKTDSYTNVAKVVFATDETYASATSAPTTSVVYTTGVYTVSYDALGTLYSYTVYNAKGEANTVSSRTEDYNEGLYILNTDGTLNDTVTGEAYGVVVGVYGTTVAVDNNGDYIADLYITVGSTATVTDLAGYGFGVYSEIAYVATNGVASLVYVVG